MILDNVDNADLFFRSIDLDTSSTDTDSTQKLLANYIPKRFVSQLVLHCQGKYEAAEEMKPRALEGKEKVLGVEHPNKLVSVYCLAYLFHTQQRYDDASVLYLRASAGFLKALGPDHPTTQNCSRHYSSMIQKMES